MKYKVNLTSNVIMMASILMIIAGVTIGISAVCYEYFLVEKEMVQVIEDIANIEYTGYNDDIKYNIKNKFNTKSADEITKSIESKVNSKYIDVTDLVMNATNEKTRGIDKSIVELEKFKWYIDKSKVIWEDDKLDTQEVKIYDLSYELNKDELEYYDINERKGNENYKYKVKEYERLGSSLGIQLESNIDTKYVKISYNMKGIITSVSGLID